MFRLGQTASRKRADFHIDVRHADGGLERKSIGEAVDAIKLVVKSVICGVTKFSGATVATWQRDSVCRDLSLDRAVTSGVITSQLAGTSFRVYYYFLCP
jgi:hypothetical protein